MIIQLIQLMIVPVLISAVASFVVGYLWYGPLFGRVWVRLAGITQPTEGMPMPTGMAWRMIAHLVLNICTTATLFLLVVIPGSVVSTYVLTLIAWIGFMLPQHISELLWKGKSFKLIAFENAATLVTLAIAINILYFVR